MMLIALRCVDRFGACNDLKTQLDQCFEAEKRVKRKAALAKARRFTAKWKAKCEKDKQNKK